MINQNRLKTFCIFARINNKMNKIIYNRATY